jgi:DUF1009 family protein
MRKLGLIAGSGRLPVAIASEARAMGYTVVAVALEPLADRSLAESADEIHWINVGKLGAIIGTLKKRGVNRAVMAGKVPKSLIYKSRITPDLRAVKVLFSLRDRKDDSILLAITNELEKEGITLLKTTDFTTGLLTPEGVLTRKQPSKEEWKDIAFGWQVAKEIGRLDIGQTVVVKNLAVMAIEAIEGTDEVSKPRQDMRFDVPVVGLDTLRTMIDVKARVLAVEAKKSILLDREEMISDAQRARISIVGYRSEG